MTQTWAVVPTRHRDYDPDGLVECLRAIGEQVTGTVVVDNNDEKIDALPWTGSPVFLVHHVEQPPNLSRLYNIGMAAATTFAVEGSVLTSPAEDRAWNLALLNDDVLVPPGWVQMLSDALRETKAAAAYIDRAGRSRYAAPQFTQTPAAGFGDTMTCWACLVRGEWGIRWDEDLRWWYGDNLLDLQCRLEEGGVVVVPGDVPVHKHPSKATVESTALSEQAWKDEQTFKEKVKRWGL
jgi:hypothetical protein